MPEWPENAYLLSFAQFRVKDGKAPFWNCSGGQLRLMREISEEVFAAYRRLSYYAAGVVRELVPRSLSRVDYEATFRELENSGALPAVLERVNYYNGLVPERARFPRPASFPSTAPEAAISSISPSISGSFRRI